MHAAADIAGNYQVAARINRIRVANQTTLDTARRNGARPGWINYRMVFYRPACWRTKYKKHRYHCDKKPILHNTKYLSVFPDTLSGSGAFLVFRFLSPAKFRGQSVPLTAKRIVHD